MAITEIYITPIKWSVIWTLCSRSSKKAGRFAAFLESLHLHHGMGTEPRHWLGCLTVWKVGSCWDWMRNMRGWSEIRIQNWDELDEFWGPGREKNRGFSTIFKRSIGWFHKTTIILVGVYIICIIIQKELYHFLNGGVKTSRANQVSESRLFLPAGK